MLRFVSRLLGSRSKAASQEQAHPSSARRKFQPTVEHLESREVPAASVLRDVNLGPSSSSPAELVNFNGILYFSADDGIHGRELWRSNGTQGGTNLLKDIILGVTGSDPQKLTVAGSLLYFTADDGIHGRELWRTDGTPGGTVLARDINIGPAGSDPTELTEFYDLGYTKPPRLYFAANDGIHGIELWRSRGTPGATSMVRDINSGAGDSTPTYLTVVNQKLFYRADDGIHGAELWRTRAKTVVAPITTSLVADIYPGSAGSSPFNLTKVGGAVYFGANDGLTGAELWRNDNVNGTYRVRDINPGSGDSLEESRTTLMANVLVAQNQRRLLFAADDGSFGRELWVSNGTFAGTFRVKDINPGSASSNPSMQQQPLQNRRYLLLKKPSGIETLLFSADDGILGRELWRTNGALAGTFRVRDITIGPGSGILQDELIGIVYKNTAYFAASNGDTLFNNELWRSNGTQGSTQMEQDINPGSAASNPSIFQIAAGNVMFFVADRALLGNEPWRLPAL